MTRDALRLTRLNALLESGAARTIRTANGLSLRVLAAEIGCTPAALVRWELGSRKPRPTFALKYLEILEQLTGRAKAS